MKNYLTLVLALSVVSSPAFASRARLESLGEGKNGSYYIDDSRNMFLNPASIVRYKKKMMLELGGQVRHERVVALVEAFVKQLSALCTTLPTQAELDRVARRATRDARDLLDEPAALAEAVGKAAVTHLTGPLLGKPPVPPGAGGAAEGVESSDVSALGGGHFLEFLPGAAVAEAGSAHVSSSVSLANSPSGSLPPSAPTGRAATRTAGEPAPSSGASLRTYTK